MGSALQGIRRKRGEAPGEAVRGDRHDRRIEVPPGAGSVGGKHGRIKQTRRMRSGYRGYAGAAGPYEEKVR